MLATTSGHVLACGRAEEGQLATTQNSLNIALGRDSEDAEGTMYRDSCVAQPHEMGCSSGPVLLNSTVAKFE